MALTHVSGILQGGCLFLLSERMESATDRGVYRSQPAAAHRGSLEMLDRPESDNPCLADLFSRRPVWANK